MWTLSGLSRKISSLSNPSTATSSVYSNGGMGAYKDAKEIRANGGGGKANTRQLSMDTVFEEVFNDKKQESIKRF